MIGSADEFIRLRTSEAKADYDRAAHDEAPLEVWLELVRDHPEMKRWVVHNKTVPIEILEALSTDESIEVRHAVAMKRKAPRDVLARLARDSDSGVRHAVACNAKTPCDVLAVLARDFDSGVRHAVACNAKTRVTFSSCWSMTTATPFPLGPGHASPSGPELPRVGAVAASALDGQRDRKQELAYRQRRSPCGRVQRKHPL